MANWVVGTKCERQWGSGSNVEFQQGKRIAIQVCDIVAVEEHPEWGCDVFVKGTRHGTASWLFESFETIMDQLKGA